MTIVLLLMLLFRAALSSKATTTIKDTSVVVSSFTATEHGVAGNGRHDDTIAMQQLLDAAPPFSELHIPIGSIVITGPLTIRQNHLTLRIDGRLQAWDATAAVMSKVWPRLPPLPTYGESRDVGQYMQYQALIYAANVTHLTITGHGTIDGRGQAWWDAFRSHNRKELLKAGRPNLIQLVNASDVTISMVHLQDAPFWTLHPVLSEKIYIYNISITAPLYAPNVDGIDIE
jgi:polygalacturonase